MNVSLARANKLAEAQGELPLHVFQHHSAKDRFTPRMERDAKFFFNSSSVGSDSSKQSFDAENPGFSVVFEVYHHHLDSWSREFDEAEVNGTVAARAESGHDHHLQFVGHLTYTLPQKMQVGKRYMVDFEEMQPVDAEKQQELLAAGSKPHSHPPNLNPAVVEYAKEVRRALLHGCVCGCGHRSVLLPVPYQH